MTENNIFLNVYSFLRLFKNKKSNKFALPILLGVLYKLNSIALFIIPIQAIKSVSEKKFSSIIINVFEFFKLNSPPDQYVYLFFLILIVFALFTLLYIHKLKTFYVDKIKKELFLLSNNLNNNLQKKNTPLFKKQLNKKINNFILNSENIFFCLSLFILIFLYDYQISLIIILGFYLYLFMDDISNYNFNKVNKNKTKYSIYFYEIFLKFFKVLNIDKKMFKPITSTMIMIFIMTLLFLRTNSSISIIFIFLIRIFQNNMLNSLRKFLKGDKLPF